MAPDLNALAVPSTPGRLTLALSALCGPVTFAATVTLSPVAFSFVSTSFGASSFTSRLSLPLVPVIATASFSAVNSFVPGLAFTLPVTLSTRLRMSAASPFASSAMSSST
jgi:hypothetical protein